MKRHPTHLDYASRDIYMDWEYENALLRRDNKTKQTFVKFSDDERGETMRDGHSKFVTDIKLYGRQITKEEYDTRKIIENREYEKVEDG